MARYFTNTEAFVDQDLSDLNKLRTYQPGEYWLIWADWTRKYENCYPGDVDDESARKFWAEKTEEEFLAVYNNPDVYTAVLQSTTREEDYIRRTPSPNRRPWREVFGVQEAE